MTQAKTRLPALDFNSALNLIDRTRQSYMTRPGHAKNTWVGMTECHQDFRKIGRAWLPCLFFHGNEILTFRPDGCVHLCSRNWKTVTTKSRLNDYGPRRVVQRGFLWYVEEEWGREPFFDGYVVGDPEECALARGVSENFYDAAYHNALSDYREEKWSDMNLLVNYS